MSALKFYAGLLLALAAGEGACDYVKEELGYVSRAEDIQVYKQPGTECFADSERGCLRHKGGKLELKIPE